MSWEYLSVPLAKLHPQKSHGSSPGAKHSCSKLSGFHRPSTVCSNAVLSKLSVKGCSSVYRCRANNRVPSPQCHWIRLIIPCVQTLLLAGALDRKAGNSTGQRQCSSLQCSPVHGSRRVLLPKTNQPTPQDKRPHSKTRQTRPRQTQHQNQAGGKQTKQEKKKGGGRTAKDRRN